MILLVGSRDDVRRRARASVYEEKVVGVLLARRITSARGQEPLEILMCTVGLELACAPCVYIRRVMLEAMVYTRLLQKSSNSTK